MTTPRARRAAAARAGAATLAAAALIWGLGAWDAPPVVSYTPVVAASSDPTAPAPTRPATAGAVAPAEEGAASDDGAAVSYTAGHLRIGDLVDVPVVETVTPNEEGVVRPSTMTGAALADLPGVAAEVFVMHTGGATPGTSLTGPDGEPAVEVGDLVVTPDGASATVTEAYVVEKDVTGERTAAAFAAPESVVVITCRPEGTPVSTSNVVVVAERVRT